MTTEAVFRFAPSPNGALHLGHAFSALLTFDMARALNGRFLLRIEDIDVGRSRADFETQIYQDLAWLGIEWESPVRRQSEHFAFYRDALTRLEAMDLLFPCFASRKDIADAVAASGTSPYPHDPDGTPLYPGLGRALSGEEIAAKKLAGEPYALRIDIARAAAIAADKSGGPVSFLEFDDRGEIREISVNPGRWGDAVIARKDVPTSYHLAVVLDDAFQAITHVTRGQDLLASTDVHRLLQILLDLPQPLYHHHRLIRDETGRKLAKSHEDKSLKSLRENGAQPDDIRKLVGLDKSFEPFDWIPLPRNP